jgi:hypothetical protein
MRKALCVFAFGLILLAGSTVASAQSSSPVIQGGVQGVELCPKFICGLAIFTGIFQGQVGANPNASAIITAAIDHTQLPTVEGGIADITGGVWELRTFTRRIRGDVVTGGIRYKGGNLFDILIVLKLTSPGTTGYAVFLGELNHNTPIPTFGGSLIQVPTP